MFIDYKNLVFQDYQKKKLANAISLNLINPTSAGLKAECKAVCELRYDKKDEKSLKGFLGQYDDKAGCLKAIAKCETDKFKPLVNFLKGKTFDPDKKYIELLAWLIDFDLRPYEFGKKYDTNKYEDIIEQEAETHMPTSGVEHKTINEPLQTTAPEAPDTRKVNFKKTGLWAIVISLLIGGNVYWLFHYKNSSAHLTGQEKCMYWADDHYEQISCNQKIQNKIIIAFDSVKLNNFKKITRPDTITLKAKGHVWYTKIKGEIEFYTSDGFHPVDLQLRLKPITDYIIKKYIFHESP